MIFNGHNLKGLLKLSLCLTTVLLLSSCSTTTPTREIAGNENVTDEIVNTEFNTNKDVANRPAFTQKRLKSNDMY